ncbi:hypothetical protein O3P69_008120 [Scylla paramamosain]|uniref:Cadherin domain-containing protein n=1 Tax=Scylla paramamosain TaxID=85552 RepID=A0AAW0T141_SCYPA
MRRVLGEVSNVVSSERRDELSKSSEWVKNPNSATSEGKHVSTLSTQRDRPGREARVRLLSSVPQETHWDCGHHKHHSRVQQEHRARRRSRRYLRKRHQRSPQDRPVGHHRQHLPLLRFSQPEYHLTLREDVPIHTSILTISLTCLGVRVNMVTLAGKGRVVPATITQNFTIPCRKGGGKDEKARFIHPPATCRSEAQVAGRAHQRPSHSCVPLHTGRDQAEPTREMKVLVPQDRRRSLASGVSPNGDCIAVHCCCGKTVPFPPREEGKYVYGHLILEDYIARTRARHRDGRPSLADERHGARVTGGEMMQGIIYILRQLDHEGTGGHYTLKVTAEEQGGGWQWPRPAAKVNIQVTDAPEPPHFDSEHYQFTVSEFARAGSYVGTVRASDDDGDLDRYFLHGAELTEAFSIDVESGVITLNEAPDGTRWEFHLQAGASDRQGHVALVPVSVYVLTSNPSYGHLVSVDQGNNGHRPAFRDCEDYDDIHVMENVTAGSPVLTVVATDEDNGPSGFIAYSLIHSFSSFAIQALNRQGKITTTRRLDRDEGDVEFLLTVVAKDGGSPPLQASCSFRVIVDDLNDNPPVFDQTRYEQTLATDHSLALPVLRVSASDRDAGRNAHLTYHLEGHPNHLEFFYLEPITGVLSLKRPLSEAMANTKTFEVRVRAVDGGTPPLWSTAPITVRVVSSGELPPSVSSQHPRQPAIPENTTENTDVVVLCARSNLPNAPNVYFTLLNGDTAETNADGTFALRQVPDNEAGLCGESNGISIFVATKNLDYETLQAYRLNLLIVNDRNVRLEQQVVVNILDVNDNAPLLQAWDGGNTGEHWQRAHHHYQSRG